MKRGLPVLAALAGVAAILLTAARAGWLPALTGLFIGTALLMMAAVGFSVDSPSSDQLYRELFEKTPQPMWVYDAETLAFLAVNEAAIRHYGYSAAEFLSMRLTDVRRPENNPSPLGPSGPADRPRAKRECLHQKKDGTVFPVEMVCRNLTFEKRPAVLALSTDILDHRRDEQRLRTFSDLGRRLSALRTPQEAAQILMDTADQLFGWDACTFDLLAPDQTTSSTILCIDTLNGRRVDVSEQCPGTTPSPYAREAIERGAQLVLRPQPAPGSSAPGEGLAASLMYAPVRNDAKAIAVLSIQSYTPDAYSEQDLRTLQALADHCGGALERIRAEQEITRLNGELEKRVRDRTAQLEAINKELETFSYSVSHDLRAPLRSIRGFSEVLLERHADQLDEQGREFLRRACESSHQMDLLIEDLLKFSRVGRNELVRQSVDLSAMAQSLAGELRKTEPERIVEFVITPGLRAQGDERLLRVAMDNLLSNAWKFTRKQPQPRIEFGFAPESAEVLFVRDNGAGFDMRYASKLFGVFHRLHSADEFPGTGVGLATVQRIINRHGGRIWAEAAPDDGATFYFTLPPEAAF